MIELAQEYGADPDVLTDIMSRIFACRRCGISTDFDMVHLIRCVSLRSLGVQIVPRSTVQSGSKATRVVLHDFAGKEGLDVMFLRYQKDLHIRLPRVF